MDVYLTTCRTESLQRIMGVLLVTWGFSGLLYFSAAARMINICLLFGILILAVVYFIAARNKDTQTVRVVGRVRVHRLEQACRICWIAAAVVLVGAEIVTGIQVSAKWGSLYEVVDTVSAYATPLLVFCVPFCVQAVVTACRKNDADQLFHSMKRRKKLTGVNVILVAISTLLVYFMLFYIAPAVSKTSPEYAQGSQMVQTHSLDTVLDYKSEHMTQQTAQELWMHLPFCMYQPQVDADLQTGALTVTYTQIDQPESEVQKTVVYNSTMAFALLDDLRQITFDLDGQTVTVSRSAVTSSYDDFEHILTASVWMSELKKPLENADFVASQFAALTAEEPQA